MPMYDTIVYFYTLYWFKRIRGWVALIRGRVAGPAILSSERLLVSEIVIVTIQQRQRELRDWGLCLFTV